MFGFKAYIWDNLVYIGDHAYKTNEILTEYLNISTPETALSKYLRDLEKLMPRLQIFDDDYDVETNYDKNAQHAQQMFFKIGSIHVSTINSFVLWENQRVILTLN